MVVGWPGLTFLPGSCPGQGKSRVTDGVGRRGEHTYGSAGRIECGEGLADQLKGAIDHCLDRDMELFELTPWLAEALVDSGR